MITSDVDIVVETRGGTIVGIYSASSPRVVLVDWDEFQDEGRPGIVYEVDSIAEMPPDTAELVRKRYGFRGYLHLKIIPGSNPDQVEHAMRLATRVSVNVEAPRNPEEFAVTFAGFRRRRAMDARTLERTVYA